MNRFSVTPCLGMIVAATLARVPAAQAADGACTATTKAAYSACLHDKLDDYWIAKGKCRNESEAPDLQRCLDDASSTLTEENALCADQRDARAALCAALGEAPYDPEFERLQFVDPRQVGKSIAPNPWFPLINGRTMVYKSRVETVRVRITNEVKVIDNVPCLVVHDTVYEDGEVTEDTIDWFAQDTQGNVWYCGEATAEYVDGFPAATDGSFQADVDGARPGIIIKAVPVVGDVYRQEFDLGNAEDAAKVIKLHGTATTKLASCAGTCLVTEETTPLEPGAVENKYYKPGVGFILQTSPGSNVRLELVQIVDTP